MNRSDYFTVYQTRGVDGLNDLITRRFRDRAMREREFSRMERQGGWQVIWDEETGTGRLARAP